MCEYFNKIRFINGKQIINNLNIDNLLVDNGKLIQNWINTTRFLISTLIMIFIEYPNRSIMKYFNLWKISMYIRTYIQNLLFILKKCQNQILYLTENLNFIKNLTKSFHVTGSWKFQMWVFFKYIKIKNWYWWWFFRTFPKQTLTSFHDNIKCWIIENRNICE